MIFIMENVSTYLSASMNMDPLCCRQVPLLLIWFLEILRGCGNPEWYQVPSQLCGNWHCCCGVVKPILINAKHMTVRLSKLSMFSCFPSSSSPEIDSLKASYKKSTFCSFPVNKSCQSKTSVHFHPILFLFLHPELSKKSVSNRSKDKANKSHLILCIIDKGV